MQGDDERMVALLVSWLVGFGLVITGPFLIWKSRRHQPEQRVVHARTLLGFALFALWWLDAAVVMHAFDVEEQRDYYLHGWVVAFFSVFWLALSPWRAGRWRETLLGPLLLALVAAALLPVGWSREKAGVLAVERCLGQPLDVLQRELADEFVSAWDANSDEIALDSQARVRDLDLSALAPSQLQISVLGGCDLWIEDGRVVRAYFNYD